VVFVVLWAILQATLPYFYPESTYPLLILLPGALGVAVVGLIDDAYGLSAKSRAAVHLAASMLTVLLLGGVESLDIGTRLLPLGLLLGSLATGLLISWSINLYNFMDGIDGFAGTEAIFVFGSGGAFLWHAGAVALGISALILAATVAGFFVWNRPQAKIFMGDVGSGFLGFMGLAFAVIGEKYYSVPVLIWVILYSVFWVDASLTLIRRISRGESWYTAHRTHAYQKLRHQLGWSLEKILKGTLCLNGLLAVIAYWSMTHRQFLTLGCLLAFGLVGGTYAMISRAAANTRIGINGVFH